MYSVEQPPHCDPLRLIPGLEGFVRIRRTHYPLCKLANLKKMIDVEEERKSECTRYSAYAADAALVEYFGV